MSELSSLSELARFVGQSSLSSGEPQVYRRTINAIAGRLNPRPAPARRVSDLLSVVLALSARTRRMVMPRVSVELDVFAPGGTRAARVSLPR